MKIVAQSPAAPVGPYPAPPRSRIGVWLKRIALWLIIGVITLAATMRKVQGADPAHGDWQFVEYKRSSADAAFATDPSLTGATCWSCHQIAQDTDWVFTPLDP